MRRTGGARARLSRKLSDADAIALFAEHHIVQVRRRKNGEIIHVKHCTWGWISPKAYYAMQKFEDVLPQIVEGGYRAKAALWSLSVEVLGFSIPLGLLFPSIAAKGMIDAYGSKNVPNFVYWAAAFFLPFGEVLTVKTISDWIAGDVDWILQVLGPSAPYTGLGAHR